VITTLTWSKPAHEQHAHVGKALAQILERLPGAAKDLALYLFRTCIHGQLKEIDLYTLPLGGERMTVKRHGKHYGRTTLRAALSQLVELGIVVIDRAFRGGTFRLTVQHPGPTRPFVKNLNERLNFRPFEQNSDKTRPEIRMAPFPITEDLRDKAEAHKTKICSAPPPKSAIVVEASPCQGQAPSAFAPLSLDTEPLPPHRSCDHRGEGEELDEATPEFHTTTSTTTESNPDAESILCGVREVTPLNPQLKAEVLQYKLHEVQLAISHYQKKNQSQKTPIKNPSGWLIKCLREKWATPQEPSKASHDKGFPLELVRWYEWATAKGIVANIPLRHCPTRSLGSPSGAAANRACDICVRVIVPKENRRLHDPEFETIHWERAIQMYPMPQQLGTTDSSPDISTRTQDTPSAPKYQTQKEELVPGTRCRVREYCWGLSRNADDLVRVVSVNRPGFVNVINHREILIEDVPIHILEPEA
jgi:hypothetical protein